MSKLGTAKAQGSISVPGTLVVTVIVLILVAAVTCLKLLF